LSDYLPDDFKTIALAHEMGHVLLYMRGGSEKQFPHLRLYRKDGKHRLKSDKYRRSLLAEEQQAWVIAKDLLQDLEPEHDKNMLKKTKADSLGSYRE